MSCTANIQCAIACNVRVIAFVQSISPFIECVMCSYPSKYFHVLSPACQAYMNIVRIIEIYTKFLQIYMANNKNFLVYKPPVEFLAMLQGCGVYAVLEALYKFYSNLDHFI